MSKLQKTQVVELTNDYNNSSDADRSHDVSARVTLKADGTSVVREGLVKIKGGDAIVAAFSKPEPGMGSLTLTFPGNPATVTVKAAVEDVCTYLDEVSALAAEV